MNIADGSNGMQRAPDNLSESSHDNSNDDHGSERHDSFVPPALFEEWAVNHDQSSQSARSWLIQFGNLQPGTNVSLRFKIEESDYPSTSPHTLVPVLTRWLRTWFERSLNDSVDRSNLSWLLQYTADYLELGHHDLDKTEIHELCLTLLTICENARQHSHLEGCLTVFLIVSKVGYFPEQCLQRTMKILSTALVILDRPLARIDTCVKLLATGTLHDAAVEALFALLLALPHIQAEKEPRQDQELNAHLTSARGSARLLTSLLGEYCDDKTPVVDIDRLLHVLKQVAKARILRMATEILSVLTNLLRNARAEDALASDESAGILLDTYELCLESEIIPDTGDLTLSKTKSPKEDADDRARRYKRDHISASNALRDAMANMLPMFPRQEAERAWNAVKGGLDGVSSNSRNQIIEYVDQHKLCMPREGSNWGDDLLVLLKNIVLGNRSATDMQVEEQGQSASSSEKSNLQAAVQQRRQQRITALRLCVDAIYAAAESYDENGDGITRDPPPLGTGTNALKQLLQAPASERNPDFNEAFFQQMERLCSAAAGNQYPYAGLIITTLEGQILSGATDDHPAIEIFVRATKCLRSIFWHGLASSSGVSNQAYQSLLKIANCKECKSCRCRLAAMALLFRIRCDTSGTVYVDTSDDSEYIASALCKTEESLKSMFTEAEGESGDAARRFDSILAKQLWIYPHEGALISSWNPPDVSAIQIRGSDSHHPDCDLAISDWMWLVTTNLQEDREWETYSFALVHLGSQLMNTKLFERSLDILAGLRGFLCGRVRERKAMFEPPKDIGLDKSDVALCFYHILTRMIPYYKLQPPNPHLQESRKGIDLVRAFRTGITGDVYHGTARSCIHALAICCYETPEAIGSEYPGIIEAMAKTVSTPHILVHILEFLAQVARLPNLHRYFMEGEIRDIFGICIAALKSLMSKTDSKPASLSDIKRASAHSSVPSHRHGLQTPYRAAMLKEKGLKQYSCALAYHTMIFWFLSIPIGQRHKYVKEVTRQLTWIDARGNSTIDEQTRVLIDLMQRAAFSDLPETARDERFAGDDYESNSFIDGNSVLTIETHKTTGRSQITKRQASGTTHAIFEPRIQPLPPHHDRAYYNELERRGYPDKVTPSHTFLNLVGSAVPIDLPEQPLKLNPNEAYVARALKSIDLKSTVDSHKVAVTLLKKAQTEEAEYLANITGTKSYDQFLDSIGTRLSLKPPCPFVPFGLLYETDGTETIAWRDRINEVVFEVSTLMPNVESDLHQARKKSHMGNCLVLIVFNQSGQRWQWDYFKSQATLVNIVITPANRVSDTESADEADDECFKVEVLTKEDYQNISAAAEWKVVSKATLGPFIRMLALNANIFSECARNELTGDNEFPSSWRYRMQEIIQLRERTQQRIHDNEDTLAKRYDFSRWT